jgi:glucokinase
MIPNVILAGDIGGTKTRLALVADEVDQYLPHAQDVFESGEHESLEAIIARFLSMHPVTVAHAGFGVAGPVKAGRSETTNLPWVIESKRLVSQFHWKSVALVNDLEAAAHGLALVTPADKVTLYAGAPNATGSMALIAPGTGLGEAGLYWDGVRHRPFAAEGGHTDFAPRDALEIELLQYLSARHEHVSYERVLSGPGIYEIYQFLRDAKHYPEPDWLREALNVGDPPVAISQLALAGRSPLCAQALAHFVSLLGAEAGNLALKYLATGGVYIAGGIAPNILPSLRDPTFLESFLAKGRMRPSLAAIPIHVVLDESLPLKGAARCAVMLAHGFEGR